MGKITVKHYLNKRLKPEQDNGQNFYPLYLSITYDRMNIRTPSNIRYGLNIDISEKDFLQNKIDKKVLFKMNYETDLFKRSVEMFKNDEDLKQLRKDYFLVYSLKKYRSKNQRLNILNSYIDFFKHSIYTVVSFDLKEKIKNAVLEKINNNLQEFDLLDDLKLKIIFSPNSPNLYDLIIKLNLGAEYENYFILWSRFYDYLAVQGNIYNYDMPYIDWKQNKGQILFRDYLKTYTRFTDKWDLDFFTDEKIDNFIEIIENIINNSNYLNKLIEIINN